MKAPRRGNCKLWTGLPAASKPREQFNSDIYGPVSVPGVNGERYFITLSCNKSGCCTVRCMASKNQAPTRVEEMINEARSVGKLEGDADVVIHTPVVHSDNDSVYRSKEYADLYESGTCKLALCGLL
jgi:hypothetical protein